MPPELVKAQLDRSLASSGFATSGRLSRFVRFTVQEALEGHGEHLKEYFLGVHVFDREETYDPRTDPIVRVEASRLRAKLSRYYQTEGRQDTVLIELPKGSYVPTFRWRQASGASAESRVWSGLLRRPAIIAIVVLAMATLMAIHRSWVLGRELEGLRRESALREAERQEFLALWGRLLERGSETTVVFGSQIFFASPRHRLFLRPTGTNDPLEVQTNSAVQRLEQLLGPPLLGPRYDYALMGDARALQQLTAFFWSARLEPEGHPGASGSLGGSTRRQHSLSWGSTHEPAAATASFRARLRAGCCQQRGESTAAAG